MNEASCMIAFPTATLVGYWLGELDGPAEAQFEEHLIGCAHCSERLRSIVQLGKEVRSATRGGHLHAIITTPFIRRLQETGIRVREYRPPPGGSVMCTVTPQDDLVVAHLHAPLRDVQRLDLVLHDLTAGTSQRMNDVAFDPTADEVVLAPNVTQLRQLDFATQRVELVAVETAGERVIGEYTFNHSTIR
jgi:Putative zinc-finger